MPRTGDAVTLDFGPDSHKPYTGVVSGVQWTFEPPGVSDGADYCPVDVTLRELGTGGGS